MNELLERLERRFGPMPSLLKRRWIKESKYCKACGIKFALKPIDAESTPRVDYDKDTKTVRGIICSRCIQVMKFYERPEQLRSVSRYMMQRKSPARSWRVEKDQWEEYDGEGI
jgi:hypothetical protein